MLLQGPEGSESPGLEARELEWGWSLTVLGFPSEELIKLEHRMESLKQMYSPNTNNYSLVMHHISVISQELDRREDLQKLPE